MELHPNLKKSRIGDTILNTVNVRPQLNQNTTMLSSSSREELIMRTFQNYQFFVKSA